MIDKAKIYVPSGKQVDKAGDKLKNGEVSQDVLEIFSAWRSVHAYPISTFQSLIRKKIKELQLDDSTVVAQRLKRLPSIVSKLKRLHTIKLSQMQDIGGIRIIVKDISSVYALHAKIINSRIRHTIKRFDDYIKSPKPDGYRSLHLCFQYNNLNHPELNGLRIELQIRTQLQHAWATAVETLGTIENESFKSGEGKETYKRFFKLVSALVSIEEKQPVLSEFQNVDRSDLVQELITLEKDLSIIAKLKGIAITTKHVDTSATDSDYFVMALDSLKNTLQLVPFTSKQIKLAEEFYASQEAKSKDNEYLSVVLVSAGDIKHLRKAYPNYFLDTVSFIKCITKFIKG